MLEFLDLIFFAGIAGAFIWLYIHDRKLEKPEVNVTINVPETKVVSSPGNYTINDPDGKLDKENIKTTNEIPIEEPDRSDDWLNVKPTDSN